MEKLSLMAQCAVNAFTYSISHTSKLERLKALQNLKEIFCEYCGSKRKRMDDGRYLSCKLCRGKYPATTDYMGYVCYDLGLYDSKERICKYCAVAKKCKEIGAQRKKEKK